MSLNETIFLTGFPGFIAGRLVKRLLTSHARLLLLVQPAFVERARADIQRIAREIGASPGSSVLMEGDITQPALGLSGKELEMVRRETTTVVHLAAVYDLAVARDVAMRVNVEGTRNVSRLVETFPRLRRYHYVSTCYVAGRRAGVIRETELRHTAGFRNHYEETKYLAEVEVEALKSRLPVTIHRPAVVCGDSQTGETVKYDGIYFLIEYLCKWPDLLSLFNIGNRAVRLNVVPVDYVVEAMAALIKNERAIGTTVHLADPNPLTSYELFETLAHAIAGHGSRFAVPAPLARRMLSLPCSGMITSLPREAAPYFIIEQTYDTSEARALLEPHAVRCPSFPSYADALVRFLTRREHHAGMALSRSDC